MTVAQQIIGQPKANKARLDNRQTIASFIQFYTPERRHPSLG